MRTLPRRAATAIAAVTLVAGAAGACAQKSQANAPAAGDASTAKVAFLMPDEASTRYEQSDRPGFVNRMRAACPGCSVLYNNANGDAAKQQQQFNSALAQQAKAIVLDPVDSTAAVTMVSTAHARGVAVIAYDRPIPQAKVDFYVSFDNEKIGQLIAKSLVDHLKQGAVPPGAGILEVNGSPTDAAAGLIKQGIHEGLSGSGLQTLAEYDTPDWEPSKAQSWVSGQISRFGPKIAGVVAANDGTGGGTVAAFKAAGTTPPPITGNDATIAGLQLILAGDQFNTISKPSEVVASAAADVVVELIGSRTPKAPTTVFGAPTRLFTPTVITRDNFKAQIIDKRISTAGQLCTPAYAPACARLGIG